MGQKISPAPGHVWAFPINNTLQRAIRSTFLHFIVDLLKVRIVLQFLYSLMIVVS
jgi:hypothetical protein